MIKKCESCITKCDDLITKCDAHYKMCQYIVVMPLKKKKINFLLLMTLNSSVTKFTHHSINKLCVEILYLKSVLHKLILLTLIWVDFLGARFEVGGRSKTRLKLVTIMLETWNFVRNFTHIFNFRKYIFQYQGPFNLADISIFFAKNQHFFPKNGTFTQNNSVKAV